MIYKKPEVKSFEIQALNNNHRINASSTTSKRGA